MAICVQGDTSEARLQSSGHIHEGSPERPEAASLAWRGADRYTEQAVSTKPLGVLKGALRARRSSFSFRGVDIF